MEIRTSPLRGAGPRPAVARRRPRRGGGAGARAALPGRPAVPGASRRCASAADASGCRLCLARRRLPEQAVRAVAHREHTRRDLAAEWLSLRKNVGRADFVRFEQEDTRQQWARRRQRKPAPANGSTAMDRRAAQANEHAGGRPRRLSAHARGLFGAERQPRGAGGTSASSRRRRRDGAPLWLTGNPRRLQASANRSRLRRFYPGSVVDPAGDRRRRLPVHDRRRWRPWAPSRARTVKLGEARRCAANSPSY